MGRGDFRGPRKCWESCGELDTERGQKYPGVRRVYGCMVWERCVECLYQI